MVHKHLHFLEKRKKLVISLKSSEQLGGNAHGKLHFVCTFKIMLLKFQPSIDYHLLIISCLTFISCNFRSGGGANPQPFIFLLLLIIIVVIIVIIISSSSSSQNEGQVNGHNLTAKLPFCTSVAYQLFFKG